MSETEAAAGLLKLFAGMPHPQPRALLARLCLDPQAPLPDDCLANCLTAEAVGWLVGAAERTMLAGLFWAALSRDQRQALPPAARQRLSSLHLGNALRWETHRRLIATYVPLLQEAGIPVAVLKGAPLVLVAYRDPAERTMADLDLLVAEEHLVAAYALLSREPASVKRTVRAHRHLGAIRLPGEAGMVELHGAAAHARSWPQTGDLLTAGQRVEVAGATVLCPGPVDLWLHVACHSLVHNPDCWPRMAADLTRLQTRSEWDGATWTAVWEAAVVGRRRRAVLVAAAMAHGAQVPEELRSLGIPAAKLEDAEVRARLAWRAAWELPPGRWGPWPRLWSLDAPDQPAAIRRHALPPLSVLTDASGLPPPAAAAAYPGYALWRCYSLVSTGLAWRRALGRCRPPAEAAP